MAQIEFNAMLPWAHSGYRSSGKRLRAAPRRVAGGSAKDTPRACFALEVVGIISGTCDQNSRHAHPLRELRGRDRPVRCSPSEVGNRFHQDVASPVNFCLRGISSRTQAESATCTWRLSEHC